MPIELFVNGRRAEIENAVLDAGLPALLAALRTELGTNGWEIRSARLDGAPIAIDSGASVDSERPAPAPQEGSRLDLEAAPATAEVDRIYADLMECAPLLASKLEEVGTAFARGEWRRALSTLPAPLDELRALFTGFQVVAGLRGVEIASGWRDMPDILKELGEHVAGQSWVGGADVILYRLVPMLKRVTATERAVS